MARKATTKKKSSARKVTSKKTTTRRAVPKTPRSRSRKSKVHLQPTQTGKKMDRLERCIAGKTYFLPAIEVDYADLTPDGMNPRYRTQRETQNHGKALTPTRLTEILRKEDATHNLRRIIETNQGLTDPLWVFSDGTIWEGCRRWVAYGLLRDDNPTLWNKVRCYLIPDDMPKDHLILFRGGRHIVGAAVQIWDVLSRAEEVWILKMKCGYANEDIANHWGLSVKQVEDDLAAYPLSVEVQKLTGGDHRYSQCDELMKIKGAKEIMDDPSVRKKMVKALADNKFKTNKNARKAVAIAQEPKALEALVRKGGTLEGAVAVLNKTKPGRLGPFRTIQRCTNSLMKERASIVRELKKKSESAIKNQEIYQEFLDEAMAIASAAGREDMIRKAKRNAK